MRLDTGVEQHVAAAVAYVSVVYQKPESAEAVAESGTAFFVNDTVLVTNHHVIANALQARLARIEVQLLSGTPQTVRAPVEVLQYDENLDLALLRIEEAVPGTSALEVSPNTPGRQTEVYAFGFPLGTMLDQSTDGPNVSLRRGYVSRLLNDGTLIEADVNIDKGVSGGPLVDSAGVVVGVIRSLAGSDYNRMYAGIAIASPLLIRFCQANGCDIKLRGGETLAANTPLPTPIALASEPPPRPRPELGDDVLRAFFSLGACLRLNSLVPRFLVQHNAAYSEDMLLASRSNMANLAANLAKVAAPDALQHAAEELAETLQAPSLSRPEELAQRADELEQACDRWVRGVGTAEQTNYDLGAWLTELSVGLISPPQDLPTVAGFLQAAQELNAAPELQEVLRALQENLRTLQEGDSEEIRRSVQRDADRLLAVGYLAPAGGGLTPAAKPEMAGPEGETGERNRIRLRIP
ncbi:MAG: trypsin-like peptidase domain-containing protein [Armatimonadetes bacterium]|nr:trypsin-like peptidase domain-containing protein [Armatimonadota bacterium]